MPDEQGYMPMCGATAGEMGAWEHRSGKGGEGVEGERTLLEMDTGEGENR